MPVPHFPPPIEMSVDTKRAIIDGLKMVIEIFKAAGLIGAEVSYASIIHDPRDLYRFIKTYRNNTHLVGDIVKDSAGAPVSVEDTPLVCGVSLAQIQQLLVKTCAKHFLEQANKEESRVVTETRKKKVLFGLLTKTETIEKKVGGGFDERKVRDISRNMAFDWQLPLLPAYNMLNSAQIFELGDDLACLQSFEHIRDFAALDQPTIKRAKAVVAEDFANVLTIMPSALAGIGAWTRDLYSFYRQSLGDAAFEFFSREPAFFMVCASLDKAFISIYGDVLAYIDSDNLEEMQRLNIDKTDVLLQGMKAAFGSKLRDALSNPNFAKDHLRKLVESMQHNSQEKAQLVQSAMITCKAVAPQVGEWLERQKTAAPPRQVRLD
jgi:hypothetical protein